MDNSYKHQIIIKIGVLFILAAAILLKLDSYQNKVEYQKEIQKIETFLEQEKIKQIEDFDKKENILKKPTDYIAVLEIPKIRLKKGLFDINDVRNNVDQNIQIVKNSQFPNERNGNLILAGHSGIGSAVYFNHLNALEIGDTIFLYYHGIKYIYQLSLRYEIEKTGYFTMPENQSEVNLILITCKMNSHQQLVFISKLQNQETI